MWALSAPQIGKLRRPLGELPPGATLQPRARKLLLAPVCSLGHPQPWVLCFLSLRADGENSHVTAKPQTAHILLIVLLRDGFVFYCLILLVDHLSFTVPGKPHKNHLEYFSDRQIKVQGEEGVTGRHAGHTI